MVITLTIIIQLNSLYLIWWRNCPTEELQRERGNEHKKNMRAQINNQPTMNMERDNKLTYLKTASVIVKLKIVKGK
jgi:hypothetical protein